MRSLLNCRRTFIAFLAIASLLILGIANHMDVAYAIAAVAIGLAGANATESVGKAMGAARGTP